MRHHDLTLYVDGESRFHTIHPCNKLAYVLLTGVVVYCAPGDWIPDIALLGLNLLIALMSGVLTHVWKFMWKVLFPIAFFMLPIHGFLYPGNQTPLANIQGFVVYDEGIRFALTVILQLATLLTASLLFVQTTHPADFITSLTQAGLPPFSAYLIGGPLLMLPAMRERIRGIQAAQRSRGLDSEGSFIKRIRALGPLISPLVLGAFAEIEQRAIALELRGFSLPGKRTSLRVVADSPWQRTLRWSMLCASLLLLIHFVFLR